MKREHITEKIIELAKKIAKHWRMEIYVGCWVKINRKARLVESVLGGYYFTRNGQWNKSRGIPIPSVSDCEQKLVEMGYESMNLQRRPFEFFSWMTDIWDKESHDLDVDSIKRWGSNGDSLHEVVLETLLKALKNSVA